jgi:hypothetical protein
LLVRWLLLLHGVWECSAGDCLCLLSIWLLAVAVAVAALRKTYGPWAAAVAAERLKLGHWVVFRLVLPIRLLSKSVVWVVLAPTVLKAVLAAHLFSVRFPL